MENRFYIAKGPNYKIVWALVKEATALKLKIKQLLPVAKANYAKAKAYVESCDYPIASFYMPYHCYDEIKSLDALAKELRDKSNKLKAWLDKFKWFSVTENNYTFEKAECTKQQKDFLFDLRVKYKSLIEKFYPKGGDTNVSVK